MDKQTQNTVLRITAVFLVAATIERGYYFIYSRQNKEAPPERWTTYVVEPKAKVKKSKTTDSELSKLRLKTNKKLNARSPASVAKKFEPPRRGHRLLLGDNTQFYTDESEYLEFTNQYDPTWKDMLGESLLKFMPAGTQAFVKSEKSFIKISKNLGTYIEEVLITYRTPEDKVTSFRASVNPETGRIMRTWSFTRYENNEALRVTPTGAIYKGF